MTATATMTGTSADLVHAIEATWQAIRDRHPDVPDVVVTLGAGSLGHRGALVLGHFAPLRWQRGADAVHELFVGGEGLARGARAVLGTLLHEAAHGIASTRGVQDTSRQGRYHNGRFRGLAVEVGIEVEHSKLLGWSTTTLPDHTADAYAEQVANLEAAIFAHRRIEGGGILGPGAGPDNGDGDDQGANGDDENPEPKTKKNGHALVCGCGRKIRCSNAVHEAGPILCGLCNEPFSLPEPD